MRHTAPRTAWRSLLVIALIVASAAALLPLPWTAPGRALAANYPTALQHAFTDTAGIEADFDLLGALRLLQGDGGLGSTVRPRDPVTRAEFTVLVLRLRGLEADAAAYAGQNPPFADALSIPAWSWGYVGAAVHHGLIQGYDDGTFRAQNPVMLAEAAAMLTRLLGRSDEMRAGLSWPESYLELSDRIGLSGIHTGYANVQLDRAGLAHLAANALTVALDRPDSGQTLLVRNYGWHRTTLTAAGSGSVTTATTGTVPLADPYLWAGAPPALITGQLVDVLRLPDGAVAWIGRPGTVSWSPDGYLGYLSDEVSPRAAGMISWWQGYLASETTWAGQQPASAGALRTAAVQLSLPGGSGSYGYGFLRIRGTTSQSRLRLKVAPEQPWVDVTIGNGAFDQRVYFLAGRGEYGMQFMTPVPGQPDYGYPDLTFTGVNLLMLPHDPTSGLTLLWPRAARLEVADYVDVVAYGISDPYVYIRVSRNGWYLIHRCDVVNGTIAARIYLTRGAGAYDVRLCLPGQPEGYYRLSEVAFEVLATAPADGALAPAAEIQSGNRTVHEFAVAIAEGRPDAYSKAKAVYRWLGRNIAYDVARANDPAAQPLTTLEILARGKGVCQDYANVFAALCRSLGVPARMVIGQAPLSGGEPHAWNEFWDGGRWVALDATWGAGYVRNGAFVPAPTDDWFDRDLTPSHAREEVWTGWRSESAP